MTEQAGNQRGGNEFDADVVRVGELLDAMGERARGEADAGLESRVVRLSHPVLARQAGDVERELLFEDEASRRGGWLGRGSRGVRMAAVVAILAAAGFAYVAVRGVDVPAASIVAENAGEASDDAVELAGLWSDETSAEIDALFGEIGVLETTVRSGVGASELAGDTEAL